MKRISFNGGELSPALALRSDLDAYQRGCASLVNFAVSATGGIRRRRGFRWVADACEEESRLLPFVYSQEVTYLVELSRTRLRVLNRSHEVVAEFKGRHEYTELGKVTFTQLNALLLLASPEWPLMVLRLSEEYKFTYGRYEYAEHAWETVDLRDSALLLEPVEGRELYRVTLPGGEELREGEYLRASYYTERQEATATAEELLDGLGEDASEEAEQRWVVLNGEPTGERVDEVTGESVYMAGTRIASCGELRRLYYTCVKAEDSWQGSRDFVTGLTSPDNYGEDFAEVLDPTGFEDVEPVYQLSKSQNYARGAKLVLLSGYWELWHCVRDFGPADYKAGCNSFEQYPLHFVRGIPVGDELRCKGPWKFQCSGNWYGAYEVRKNAGGDEWETLATSESPIGAASNNILTGDEAKECRLGLFLTRTRVCGETPLAGWPPNSCSNALVVPAYKRDLVLVGKGGGTASCTASGHVYTALETSDWSRAAFNEDFGYPGLVALHEGRLVLAATRHQPQTLWFSQTDDLNNFALDEEDTGALLLTMQTETQSAICWLASHGDALMVGTMDAEWTISAGGTNSFTATSARCRNYGYRGSAPVPALRAENKVLYCERGAARVMEYGYKEEVQGYVSNDTTVFADHIARAGGGIVQGTLLRKPDYVAVFLLADGTLALMTYNTMHNVNAWHRYVTDGRIESVCALPAGNADDALYAVVVRDGKRNIEVLNESSPYEDEGGRDYESVVVTTTFSVADANDRKRPVGAFQAYFATPTPADAVRVSTGGDWRPIAYSGELEVGWVRLVAASTWEDLPWVGILVRGPVACEVLAAQV